MATRAGELWDFPPPLESGAQMVKNDEIYHWNTIKINAAARTGEIWDFTSPLESWAQMVNHCKIYHWNTLKIKRGGEGGEIWDFPPPLGSWAQMAHKGKIYYWITLKITRGGEAGKNLKLSSSPGVQGANGPKLWKHWKSSVGANGRQWQKSKLGYKSRMAAKGEIRNLPPPLGSWVKTAKNGKTNIEKH